MKDKALVVAALAHGAALVGLAAWGSPWAALPAGVLMWWTAQTSSHNFIHRPFLGGWFSAYLSVILGFPQELWRVRHLRHHEIPARCRARIVWEVVLALPVALAFWPGWLLGMALCWLQGHYEHARDTTSTYGAVYNFLFFRDGYHVEHHRHPGRHWSRLEREEAVASRWCPVLRWMEWVIPGVLGFLEGIVLRSPRLQRAMIDGHARAMEPLLPHVRHVAVVGGGLFPRSVLALRKLRPDCRITVIDRSAANLERARRFADFESVQDVYKPGGDYDLVVIPLAYVGDRTAIYRDPPAPFVLVHDWIWRATPQSRVVSWLLLKRINLCVGLPDYSLSSSPLRS